MTLGTLISSKLLKLVNFTHNTLTLNETDFPPLSPPAVLLYLSQYNLINVPTLSNKCDHSLFETHGSNNVISLCISVSTKTLCKPAGIVSCN